MKITFDPAKRDKALAERGLNFEDAELIFEGVTVDIPDTRQDYGELRVISWSSVMPRAAMFATSSA